MITIVGPYSAAIVEKTLQDNKILYTMKHSKYDVFTFDLLQETDYADAMEHIQQAMRNEVDKLLER